MQSRHREALPLLSGALLLFLIIFFLAIGCDRVPTGCPPFPNGQLEQSTGPSELSAPTDSSGQFDSSPWICLLFPPLCETPCPPYRPFDPMLYWGGPDFSIKPSMAGAHARWHNQFLDFVADQPAAPDAGFLVRNWLELAAANEIKLTLGAEGLEAVHQVLQAALDGSLGPADLPSVHELLLLWDRRPPEGPFADHPELRSLLSGLEDGISPVDVAGFQRLSSKCQGGEPREAWASACMAASVTWWDKAQQQGLCEMPWGASADIAAAQFSGSPEVVGIASAAGLIIDLLERFWGRD